MNKRERQHVKSRASELNGETFCGCLSGLDESCISDETAHTTAELKVAGLLSRNNGSGHKCCLVSALHTTMEEL